MSQKGQDILWLSQSVLTPLWHNGLQGKSYAIPSMSGIGVMSEYVKEFCEFAKAHPDKHFFVTPIGCGIAGYSETDVAPLFEICRNLKNVSLPASFWDIIGSPTDWFAS